MRFHEFQEPSNNSDIKKQQQMLVDKGYDLGPYGPKGDGVDGLLGPYTQAAIDAFQKGISPKDAPKPNRNDVDQFEKDHPEQRTNRGNTKLPAKGPITGPYGRMVTGPKGNRIPHPGVDIGAPAGSDITAPGNGKIVYAAPAGTAGNLVELVTDEGEKHRFMHLSKILVRQGEHVRRGDVIGLVGSTGFSTGPHLHWEKYASDGKQVNPLYGVA